MLLIERAAALPERADVAPRLCDGLLPVVAPRRPWDCLLASRAGNLGLPSQNRRPIFFSRHPPRLRAPANQQRRDRESSSETSPNQTPGGRLRLAAASAAPYVSVLAGHGVGVAL